MSAAAVSEYNRLVAADAPAALEQAHWLTGELGRRGVRFAGEPMASFLRPHFVARAEWQALCADARRLLELAARVARAAFDGDAGRLAEYLGTPERERAWLDIDPGPPDVVLSRLDAFLTPGGPRFIEINSDAPAGLGYADVMAELFRELPVFRRFAERRGVSYRPSAERVVDALLGLWAARRGGGAAPCVAIVDFAEVNTRPDQEILRERFAARGLRCLLADPRELETRRGALWAGPERIDLVYRRALLQELLEREDEVAGLLGAYRDGLALFVNSLRCRLSEDKAFLGLLGDEAFAGLLSEPERRFLERVVPWTRKLEERRTRRGGREVELLPHCLERRAELVLKPAHGYGGRAVYVGDETAPAEWRQAVEAGLGRAWVVQERVPIPEEEFPVTGPDGLRFESLKLNANPFYVAGAEVGAVTRVSRSSVINVSAGGGSVPTFVLD